MASPGQKGKRKTAIAIKYDRGQGGAPRITARGKGLIAERLISLAKENKIPVVENELLVEALDKLELNRDIPAELYQVVAEILVAVYRAENARK